MKKISIYRVLAVLVTAAVFFAACTKENSNVRLDPKLSTSQVLSIKSDSATVVGFVVASGSGFTERGICYDTVTGPTTSKSKVVYTGTSTNATFDVVIPGLMYAKKYYARAYAINTNGTIYGDEITFVTLPVVPTVTTAAFAATTGTSATGGGSITNDGGASVTARGVCFSKKHNPIFVADSATTDGNGLGIFASSLKNLKGLTTYYVRAYAKNSAGIGYGPEVSFTTPAAIVTLWIAGDYQGWSPSTATDSLMNTDADPIVRGYAYISTTGGFKLCAQKSWTGTNYGAGASAGSLSTDGNSGNLNVPSAGYYLFAIDLVNMTYTATLTNWGVMGDYNGWASQTDMKYYSTSKVFGVGIHLTAGGGFKFRGLADWSLSYGSITQDGKLDTQNNNNIPVAVTGDYDLTLNLSRPNNYTYMANKWSVTGDFASWGAGVPMTWDAVNQVFTATITLSATDGWKFRANAETDPTWKYNLGGNGSGNGTADNYSNATTVPVVLNGKNIGAPGGVAGTYTVTLNPWTFVATIK